MTSSNSIPIPQALQFAQQLVKKGQFPQAEMVCRQILAIDPKNLPAHLDLGNALLYMGRVDQAIEVLRQAIVIAPDNSGAHSNLGVALQYMGRTEESFPMFLRAAELSPNDADVFINLGNALRLRGEIEKALAAHEKAAELAPDFADAHHNLGNTLIHTGRVTEALAAARRAVELSPTHSLAHDSLLYFMQFDPQIEPKILYEEHLRWDRLHGLPLAKQIPAHSNDRSPDRRLRVGYVSPDFREHAVAYFIKSLLAAHDPAQVETFCYDNATRSDSMTASLQKLVHHWRNIATLSDAQIAANIAQQDRIDILVDLAGHTAGNRLLVFARKPAPIQISYLGDPNTTGMSAIDYLLTDPWLDPPGLTEHLFSEQLIRLPRTFACYSSPIDSPPVGALPAESQGKVTFASFNALSKINPPLIACWSRILKQVPGSRLLMPAAALAEPSIARRYREAFGQEGIESERLEFIGRQSMVQLLALHDRVDIHLDSFPVNGHTTSCHALWMGVPVISLKGTTHSGRLGTSVLSHLNFSELIADDAEHYEKIAVELAGDLPRLAQLRSTLRQRMESSPLMDARGFARDVEAAYRGAWKRWCQSPATRR